ncbi:MAG: hypothetical protein KJO23_02755 [Bacteroidia bacterium]|nr:hypothetical protein [Bacteroidia bacterium]NNM22747.1 hypothetical protein [Flavobacteriaceae bacterium]
MNTEIYTSLLANPAAVTKEQLSELDAVIEKYPYFQSARALQLKGLKNEHSFLYNDALKLTAAYTTDRDILFEYITSKHFVQNEISEKILQQSDAVLEMDVVAENVSELLSLEIDKQIKSELKKAEAILNPELFERKVASIVEITQENEPSPEVKEVKKVEETPLDVDAPIPFSKSDTHSFSEWLKLTRATPIAREEDTGEAAEQQIDHDQAEKERKFQLIEKFIQDRPKLEVGEPTKPNKDLAKPYTQGSDTLMTETLAKVYLQQKNFKKAIQAYKILILKNPEKSGFFADQIRAIEKLIKEES